MIDIYKAQFESDLKEYDFIPKMAALKQLYKPYYQDHFDIGIAVSIYNDVFYGAVNSSRYLG